jgi:hypothetical protein
MVEMWKTIGFESIRVCMKLNEFQWIHKNSHQILMDFNIYIYNLACCLNLIVFNENQVDGFE